MCPLALGLLSVGCGLLVERLAGLRLPGALVVPAGFALIDERVYGAARLVFLRYNGAATGGEE